MQTKLSAADYGQMMKVAAENLRALSAENESLKEKVAHFEKKARVERLATLMEEKNLQSDLSYTDKVAALMKRENLDVVEEAVGLSAPQMKLASAPDGFGLVPTENMEDHSPAEMAFFNNLAVDDE